MLELSLDQLRTLVAVVDHGSFDAAASALHVSAPAVSQRVRALEDATGRVLVRRERPIHPTPAGDEVLATARQMLHLERGIGRRFADDPTDTDHPAAPLELPVAANADSLASWFLRALLAVPRTIHVTFDVRREDETHSADLLRRGEVMAAVTSESRPVQGCRVEALGLMRYRACAAPEFVATHLGGDVTSAALGRAPVIDFDRRDNLQTRYARALTHGTPDAPRHFIPSTHDYQRVVRGGLAWGLVPELLAGEDLATGRLVDLVPERPMDVPLYWQSWRVRSDELTALTTAVRAAAASELLPVAP